MRFVRNFSRILVGIVFMFSGFVKGVDPLGTAYRIEDYFIAYGMDWAIPLTLFLSISLCTLEFTLGAALLFNLRLKDMSWPLLFLMIYFTVLTFFDALYNPVPDCGCFGDALILTNWETFYKNIVLIIFSGIIFYSRKKFKSLFSPLTNYLFILIIAVLFAGFAYYQYNHLPLIDFRAWKVGSELLPGSQKSAKVYLTYRNKESGETKEYLSPDYPWNDSVWMSKWEFVGQRTEDQGQVNEAALKIFDLDGTDVTKAVLGMPGYLFIAVSYDLDEANKNGFKIIDRLFALSLEQNIPSIVLTGSLKEDIDKFNSTLTTPLEFFNADDIELKTMVRANPGLILVKNGIIMAKWNYNDIPSLEEIEKKYWDK